MQPYYSDLLEQACQRTKESTLSVLGISDPELREHLAEQMSQLPGGKFSFIAETGGCTYKKSFIIIINFFIFWS